MDEQQKERLEQELRFLEESLEADVISKDEYERGKKRLGKKLKELEEQQEEPLEAEERPEEQQRGETREEETEEKQIETEEQPPEEHQYQQEPQIEIKEIKEQPTKIIGAEEEDITEPQEIEEQPSEETQVEETKSKSQSEEETEEREETEETKSEEEYLGAEDSEEVNVSKKWIYGTIIIILALILFFSIRGCGNSEKETPSGETLLEEITPICSSNSDCKREGAIGTCSNPDTPEAACGFKTDIETNLLVVNDKNCKSCDSTTTKTIIKSIFPNIEIKEIDYSTEEAKNLVDKLDIDAFPAYIFDPNINEAINFNSFKSALSKRGDNYVMANTASGAIYHFKRPLIKNKLDIYLLPETDQQIQPRLNEVSALFNGKLTLDKHLVTERQKESLETELAINTYPTFLLNNQLKFRGILPADLIKEKICEVNSFEECGKELSRI